MGKARIAFAGTALLALLFLAFLMLLRHDETPVLLFAYGTNMEIATMTARAGGFLEADPAVLDGYRLVFQTNRRTEMGVANLEASPG